VVGFNSEACKDTFCSVNDMDILDISSCTYLTSVGVFFNDLQILKRHLFC
jgi:hypothetical protein